MTRSRTIRELLAVAVTAVAVGASSPASAVRPAAPLALSRQLVAGSLSFPAAFTFAPDGRIFYGERLTGEIRIFDPATSSDTLFFTIPNLANDGEQGLLGLALHPDYDNGRPFVFAYATRTVSGSTRNWIVRIRDTGGTGSDVRTLWTEDITAGSIHNGGHIAFGPDRRLYAVVGEAGNPSNSQNLNVDAGKVLRMSATGAVPSDNPFAGSVVWTYGLRNSFGFAFDPQTAHLWESENGPECNDEINLILIGRNYGWGPNETCSTPPSPPNNTNQDGPSPKLPKRFYTPTIAPTGVVFCDGCGLTGAEGAFFYGTYNNDQIRKVILTSNRTSISSVAIAYSNASAVLSIERGPDGAIYFSTSSAIYKLIQA